MAAAAPPLGLLLLGLVFDSTPIELRYLAFATPFVGLLLAGAFATLPRRAGRMSCGLVLAIQIMSLAGLMTRPETMQPARATAMAAAALVGDGVVLLPHGNDGVGIVGAFAIEAPPTLRLLVVGKDASAAQIRARAERFDRAWCLHCSVRMPIAAQRCLSCARRSPTHAGARWVKDSTSSRSSGSVAWT